MSLSDTGKQEAARLGWSLIATGYPVRTPWMTIRQDRIHIEGHGEITYSYIEAKPAVFVVPVTSSGEVVLIRQYRYPIDGWCLEIPAGGTYDFAGAPLEEVVRAELSEEIGAACGEVLPISTFYTTVSKSEQQSHVFLALDVLLSGRPHPQATEHIELQPVPAARAVAMARSGEIGDCQSALAVLMCEPYLRDRGYLAL